MTFRPTNRFSQFCSPAADRKETLRRILRQERIPFELIQKEELTLFLIRTSPQPRPRNRYIKTLTAHYDRVPGTPGANDNSAAVLQLLSLARELTHNRQTPSGDIEILLTDGEELPEEAPASRQGIYRTAPLLPTLEKRLFFVLDMTGIGDTVILGEAGEDLLAQRSRKAPPTGSASPPLRGYLRQRTEDLLLRIHNGRFFHLSTLFSDDLGLLLRGLPVVQISLMPFEEALTLKASSQPPNIPPCWQNNHTPLDAPETLEDRSFALMESLLARLSAYVFPCPLPEEAAPSSQPNAACGPLPSARRQTESPPRTHQGPHGIRVTLSPLPPDQKTPSSLTVHGIHPPKAPPETPATPATAAQYGQLRQWLLGLARENQCGTLLLLPKVLTQTPGPLGQWLRADADRKPTTGSGAVILWKSLRTPPAG